VAHGLRAHCGVGIRIDRQPARMTPEELEARAAAIYGDRWREPLSEAFGVDISTLRRWRRQKIPAWVTLALQGLEDGKPAQEP
jgi:hypothetical protein